MLQRPRVAKTAYFRCTGQWPLTTKKRATKVPLAWGASAQWRDAPAAACWPVPVSAASSVADLCQRLRRLPAGAQRARRSIDGHSPARRRRRRRHGAPRGVLSATVTPGRGSEARRTCLKPAMRAPGGPPTRRPMLLGSGNLLAGRRGARSLWVGGHTTPKKGILLTPQRVGNWNRLGRTAVWRLAARPFSPRCKVVCSAFAAARHTRLAS